MSIYETVSYHIQQYFVLRMKYCCTYSGIRWRYDTHAVCCRLLCKAHRYHFARVLVLNAGVSGRVHRTRGRSTREGGFCFFSFVQDHQYRYTYMGRWVMTPPLLMECHLDVVPCPHRLGLPSTAYRIMLLLPYIRASNVPNCYCCTYT